jgi:serine protease Do
MKLLQIALFTLPLLAQQAQHPISYLGVYTMEIDSQIAKAAGLKEEHGIVVTKVEPNSPAARAGLRERDIILDYNTQIVQSTVHFSQMVAGTPIGQKVTLSVFRNGAVTTVNAQTATRPASQPLNFILESPRLPMPPEPPMPPADPMMMMPDIPTGLLAWQSSTLGYTSEPIEGQLAEFFGVKQGVLVRSVAAKSPAEKAGLKAGDVIVKANGTPVHSPREITGMMQKRKLSLTVIRVHKEMTLELIAKNMEVAVPLTL